MRACTRSILFVLLMFVAASSAQAQGMYVERGWGAEGVYLLAEGEHTLEAHLGYVPMGLFDVGIFMERYARDNEALKYYGVGPRVTVYPIRQSESLPVTVAGRAWYSKQFLSGTDVDQIEASDGEASQYSWSAGGFVTSRFGFRGDSMVQPRVGIFTTRTTWKIEGGSLATEQTDSSTWFEIGAEIVVGEEGFRLFHIGPMVRIADNRTTYGLTVGFGSSR